jgi:very-short-patch-repair endonuclease/ribosomal protein L17
MKVEWTPTTLASVLSFSNGKSSPDLADNLPYPVYGSNGIIGFADETNADPDTIVIGRVGSYCGSLYFSEQKCWVTDNAIRANALDDNDAKFLFYLLQMLDLNHWRAGSGQPLLNQSILGSIPASIPEPPEQRAIAHILGTLDDNIELNRRRNQTLEAMARALFKDWFVDFGPVRAKMQLPSPSGRGDGGEGSNPRPRRKLPLPDAIRRHAAELRRNATDAENLLWRLLRNHQLAGAKFRRQHALPPYILDFYCHELKLAVELDGGQHNEPAGCAYDERRSAYLHAHGIEVLRFWNNDVLRDTEAVLEAIFQAIEAKRGKMPSPPAPLPEGEGSAAHAPLPDAAGPFFSGKKAWDEGAYLPRDIWDLFPDRLDDEGKPEGWRRSMIGSEVIVCGGSTPSTKEPAFWESGEHHWATPKDLSALTSPVLLDTDRKLTDAGIAKISSGLLPAGTVLLSSRAPIGYLAIAEVPTAIDQEEAVAVMLEHYEVCCGIFHGFDWSPWKTGGSQERLAVLPAAQEHVLAQDDGKNRLVKAVGDLSKAFALAVPHEQALEIRDDVAFFQAVRSVLTKGTSDGQRSPEEIEHAIRQIVAKAVSSDEVIDIFAAAGLKKSDISVLSDEFLAEVRGMPQRNLAVEMLRRLLEGEIKAHVRKNVVRARSFAALIEHAIKKYQNRAIETAQVIEELIALAKEVREANQRGEKLGLTNDEVAFYDALEVNDSAVAVLGDETLRLIAQELVKAVRNSITIDWSVRENVRAKMRVIIKRVLRKYGYPPDKQAHATELVLEQAEALCRDWTGKE